MVILRGEAFGGDQVMNGISALITEALESSLTIPPGEDTKSLQASRGQVTGAGHMGTWLWSLQNHEQEISAIHPLNLWCFVTVAWTD